MEFLEITPLIKTFGLVGVSLFVFAESGLFFGFLLPGDSLLFTAGVFASAGYINIGALFLATFIAAILGDTAGYWTGKKFGQKIFSKPDSFFFNKKNLDKTAHFYEKYGKRTVILSRFVPIVRTFAPILAGAAHMKYRDFIRYNILGGFFWTSILPLAGYYFGNSIVDIDAYMLPIVGAITLVSLIPVFIGVLRRKVEPPL